MAINVSVQYNGGLLPDIILLTQCYFHGGTRVQYRPASKKLKYRLEAGFLIFLGA